MKFFKKISAVALSMIMLVSVTACNFSHSDSNDKNTTEKTESYGHNNSEKCVKYILIIPEKCVILFSDV